MRWFVYIYIFLSSSLAAETYSVDKQNPYAPVVKGAEFGIKDPSLMMKVPVKIQKPRKKLVRHKKTIKKPGKMVFKTVRVNANQKRPKLDFKRPELHLEKTYDILTFDPTQNLLNDAESL